MQNTWLFYTCTSSTMCACDKEHWHRVALCRYLVNMKASATEINTMPVSSSESQGKPRARRQQRVTRAQSTTQHTSVVQDSTPSMLTGTLSPSPPCARPKTHNIKLTSYRYLILLIVQKLTPFIFVCLLVEDNLGPGQLGCRQL